MNMVLHGQDPLVAMVEPGIECAKEALIMAGAFAQHETVETIAASVGYSDPTSFRKVFRSIVGVVPQAYRDRFKIRRV